MCSWLWIRGCSWDVLPQGLPRFWYPAIKASKRSDLMRSFMGRSLVIEPSASFISDPDKVFIESEIYPECAEAVRVHEVPFCKTTCHNSLPTPSRASPPFICPLTIGITAMWSVACLASNLWFHPSPTTHTHVVKMAGPLLLFLGDGDLATVDQMQLLKLLGSMRLQISMSAFYIQERWLQS